MPRVKFCSESFTTKEEAEEFKDSMSEACTFDSFQEKDGLWYVWYLYDSEKGFALLVGR
jgi:hypothetical protein